MTETLTPDPDDDNEQEPEAPPSDGENDIGYPDEFGGIE